MNLWRLWRKPIRSGIVGIAVFALGAIVTAYLHHDLTQEQRLQEEDRLRDEAREFHFELQRRMDLYAGANRDLAAFFTASESVSAKEFESYVHASRFLTRLDSVNAVGFLPRVPVADTAMFERQVRDSYPGFRVRGMVEGARFAFPLLYGQLGAGGGSADRLRGVDFSSVPERYDAMLLALERDGPAATRVHRALEDRRTPVVMFFTPIRTHIGTVARRGRRLTQVDGFAFSSVNVRNLFAHFGHHHLAEQFDLEVYDGTASAANIVFDGDRVPNALKRDKVAVHSAELRLANRIWVAQFYPKVLPGAAARFDWAVLSLGAMLSLIAGYAAAAMHRQAARRRASGELMDRFNTFFRNHPFAVYSLDPQWRVVEANEKIAQELGVSRADLLGRSAGDFVSDENREMAQARFREALSGEAVAYNNVIVDKNGRRSDVSVVLIPIVTRGKTTHVLGFAENITERKRAEEELYESRQMLRLILDSVPQRIFWKDLRGVYQGGNRTLLEDAGLESVDELIGKTDFDLAWRAQADDYRKEDAEIIESGVPRLEAHHRQDRKDGSENWVEVRKIPLLDGAGRPVGILGLAEDITERKTAELELFHRANFDSLTELPNRACFQLQLEQAVTRATRRGTPLALMYFDIDHFKSANDTYGHDVGDEVIRWFAQCARSVVRKEDLVARLGGDEFVLLLEGLSDAHAVDVVASKLVTAVSTPFQLNDVTMETSTSIGVATYRRGMTPEELLKDADQAMYEAKRGGRNCYRHAVVAA